MFHENPFLSLGEYSDLLNLTNNPYNIEQA